MGRLAIIAGRGALPHQIAKKHPEALFVSISGTDVDAPQGVDSAEISYERFGQLFRTLRGAGTTDVVMAGGMVRPVLNPARFDTKTMMLAPRFLKAMQGGDDQLLRTVVSAFEEEGFAVRGAHELLPDLTAKPGRLAGRKPSSKDNADIDRAIEILTALGPLDVGQGAVVAQSLCFGIETVQGTDALLQYVGDTRHKLRHQGGVLVKVPKPGQDLRVDMPTIGPRTIEGVQKAGLNGIVIAAGKVMIIDRPAAIEAAEKAGLFLLAKDV
ncbi:LpxI family protein [Pseudoruegeria sp. HB172150]|uniref:LpxI family protein n=1 Tax=Pseudoruegeria sp. HB172150 TaxID=2721164 RepID=UPI001551D764|nr:UDP-2,3-diacylglucosamine diphosphatase LpxI [Pseudoruegeria sp. HB172150]